MMLWCDDPRKFSNRTCVTISIRLGYNVPTSHHRIRSFRPDELYVENKKKKNKMPVFGLNSRVNTYNTNKTIIAWLRNSERTCTSTVIYLLLRITYFITTKIPITEPHQDGATNFFSSWALLIYDRYIMFFFFYFSLTSKTKNEPRFARRIALYFLKLSQVTVIIIAWRRRLKLFSKTE